MHASVMQGCTLQTNPARTASPVRHVSCIGFGEFVPPFAMGLTGLSIARVAYGIRTVFNHRSPRKVLYAIVGLDIVEVSHHRQVGWVKKSFGYQTMYCFPLGLALNAQRDDEITLFVQ